MQKPKQFESSETSKNCHVTELRLLFVFGFALRQEKVVLFLRRWTVKLGDSFPWNIEVCDCYAIASLRLLLRDVSVSVSKLHKHRKAIDFTSLWTTLWQGTVQEFETIPGDVPANDIECKRSTNSCTTVDLLPSFCEFALQALQEGYLVPVSKSCR